ncbi:MAG: DedA family protein [Actinobacteria bacterium]|uniref:Unannotated protein n=1 Tax=freshwater metagenome TaxID=449393 RepID=A0A6J7HPF0_9ZZZZ|nr:DedA family protein [Actinomycetota bacterium]MSW47422.1 DedA family protein [Actinomycetota bacterium]MSX24721.1 DedA family protein [Actinomycetota bacterium]MSY45903.1 DedA family protein [Actinomycetota bacterium]MSY56871.1 DedA family protein [Actinomycetota bacterium]
MNISSLFDAHSIVADLGLAGVLAIIFAETGLLIGLAFPGDSLLFLAGVAASGSAAVLLNGVHLSMAALMVATPIVAIAGSQLGHWFGAKYGRKFFERPDSRYFNQKRVASTEKWLKKYGTGRAIVLARFVPFVRTLISPMAGIVRVSAGKFLLWNFVGGVIWTETVLTLGYFLGEKLKGSIDKYILPIIGVIVFLSLLPLAFEILKEVRTKRHLS